MSNAAEKRSIRVLLAGEPVPLTALEEVLRSSGCEVAVATSAAGVTARLEEAGFDVLLLDLALAGSAGADLLTSAKLRRPELEVVALTESAAAEAPLAVAELDCLRKPLVDLGQAARAVARAGERKQLLERIRQLEAERPDAGASLPPAANGEDRSWLGQSYAEAKDQALRRFEKAYVEELMRECGSNISAAARKAGMDRSNFKRVLRKYRDELKLEEGSDRPRSASA